MKISALRILSALVLGCGICAWPVIAANTTQEATEVKVEAPSTASAFAILVGQWVRPDGGYRITIRGVDADGRLDAAYANPSPLPFAKAQASREGDAVKVFLELRAGGYNGSTYNLTYEAATDVLRGVYFQAVAQQQFNVYFERVKSAK